MKNENQRTKWVNLINLPVISKAAILKTYLEANNIPCCIPDYYTSTIYWHYNQAIGGIRVCVPENQLHEAQDLIKMSNSESSGIVDKDEIPQELRIPNLAYIWSAYGLLLYPFIIFQAYALFLSLKAGININSNSNIAQSMKRRLGISIFINAFCLLNILIFYLSRFL